MQVDIKSPSERSLSLGTIDKDYNKFRKRKPGPPSSHQQTKATIPQGPPPNIKIRVSKCPATVITKQAQVIPDVPPQEDNESADKKSRRSHGGGHMTKTSIVSYIEISEVPTISGTQNSVQNGTIASRETKAQSAKGTFYGKPTPVGKSA